MWIYADVDIACYFISSSYLFIYFVLLPSHRVTRWRSLLRHCASSQTIAGSIPDSNYSLTKSSGRTMALGMTQPLTEIRKAKSVPLQAWSFPDGSKKSRFPDFMTTAQKDGKIVSLTQPAAFTPRKSSRYSFLLEAESTPGP